MLRSVSRAIGFGGAVLACACGGSGDGSGGPGGSAATPTYDETEAPVAVTVTADEGGTLESAAGLLEVTFPADVVTEPTEMSVVRLTGDDVPPNAFLGIAHRVEPELSYYPSVPTATWTIPAALVRSAFGAVASPGRSPLPIARSVGVSGGQDQALFVSEYRVAEDGGIVVSAYAQSPGSALYLSTSHVIAEVTAVAPTSNERGGARFTVTPAPGSDVTLESGTIGSTDTRNWENGGGTVESDGNGGLTGSFLGNCDFGTYYANLSFELQAVLTVDGQPLGYHVWLGTSVSCPD